MHQPLVLREAATPTTVVLVRFGRTTLADDNLRRNCEVTFARWGLHGFSASELTQFARVRRHFSDPKRNPVWAGQSRR